MVNAFVIVWRESLEAMLVIGILSAWVNDRGGARTALWGGVLAGLALALALAALMQGALGILPDIIDRCQNHVLAGSRVRRHYLHHEFTEEKKAAWELLGTRLDIILGTDFLPSPELCKQDSLPNPAIPAHPTRHTVRT